MQDDASTTERTPLLTVRGKEVQQIDEEGQLASVNVRHKPQSQQSVSAEGDGRDSKPFAWKPFISISLMLLVQPVCFELIFPFISTYALSDAVWPRRIANHIRFLDQMIVENGIVDDPEKVGFYSGFIESIFQVMSFLAGMPKVPFSMDFSSLLSSPPLLFHLRSLWSEDCRARWDARYGRLNIPLRNE